MCTSKWWTTIGCVLAALGVTIGAFGAHWLEGALQKGADTKSVVDAGGETAVDPAVEKALNTFETGAEYHLLHALAIVALGLLTRQRYNRALALAGVCFVTGILLFSGALYVLVLTGEKSLGMVAPIGGTAFIVGWIAFAVGACPCGAAAAPQSRVASSESREEIP